MPAVIFSGSTVKALKKIVDLNGGAQVQSSTVNPTSVATAGTIGTILLNETTGKFYQKTDSGTSTNWREIADLTSTQTLSGKTLTTPTSDVLTLDDQASTPSNPAAGFLKLYFKTDGNLYKLNSSGVETAFATGGSAFPGTNWTKIDADSSGWSFDGFSQTPAGSSGGLLSHRRVGDTLEVNGCIQTTVGTGTTAAINLGTGLVIDSSKFGYSIQRTLVGEWYWHHGSTSTTYISSVKTGAIFYDFGGSTSKLYFTQQCSTGGTFNFVSGSTIVPSASGGLSFKFAVPIVAYAF